MKQFAPYLGILAALLLAIFIASFSNLNVLVSVPSSKTASSTVLVVSNLVFPKIVLPDLTQPTQTKITESSTTNTHTKKRTTTKVISTKKPQKPKAVNHSPNIPTSSQVDSASVKSAPIKPPPLKSGNTALDTSAIVLRKSIVNILCYTPASSSIRSISGSGTIISSNGIILTNAHVAQYFLLKNKGVSCVIRTGSPAKDTYTANLIFISPAWIHKNAKIITERTPSGTGEHDYALLAISGNIGSKKSEMTFPYIPISAIPPTKNTPVVIGSYGAQFLKINQIQTSLFPTIVFGSIKDVFTFGTKTIDVVSLGGSIAAQEGSSGGGIADANSSLVGIITTSTVTGSTSARNLSAITTSYIRSAYASETGKPIEFLLSGSVSTSTATTNFSAESTTLEAVLLSAIGT